MTETVLPRFGIVIVAAGRGERAGREDGPKQYRLIGGRPVIAVTLEKFHHWNAAEHIVVVIHRDDERLFRQAVPKALKDAKIEIVNGGVSRQESVLAGLERLAERSITHAMIHDAVRPFFSLSLLERIAAAHRLGDVAVLPVTPVADTLKRGNAQDMVVETVPRQDLFAAQTPQSFELSVILGAHRAAADANRHDFTDDAALMEWQGLPVRLVDGDRDNVKLTLKRDIELADEKMTRFAPPDVRTGNGYDVHQLEPGDGVTLCGIKIAHHLRLKGHSDADVALHALTDALLATCGAGDIGDHFPPSDMQWRGAASRIFVEHAARIVRDHGGTIMNADISIIAEAPKIGPHRQAMREMLADMLEIDLDRCSVKATTNEKIGFIGREEGIAAIATATVVYGRKSDV